MNKFNKEDLTEFKNLDNKTKERCKNHDFFYVIPFFVIKKTYDNENLVNIVLKAYSIFPNNFDKDSVLLKLQRQKQMEDEKKEEENKLEAERTKMEEKLKRMGNSIGNNEEVKNFFKNEINKKNSILNNFNTNEGNPPSPNTDVVKRQLVRRNTVLLDVHVNKKNLDYKILEKNILSQDIDESDEELVNKKKEEEIKTGVSLYSPTPGKFLNFNYDKMYSQTHVCENCNIIYMLVEDFLSNFDDGETQCKMNTKFFFFLIFI